MSAMKFTVVIHYMIVGYNQLHVYRVFAEEVQAYSCVKWLLKHGARLQFNEFRSSSWVGNIL